MSDKIRAHFKKAFFKLRVLDKVALISLYENALKILTRVKKSLIINQYAMLVRLGIVCFFDCILHNANYVKIRVCIVEAILFCVALIRK